MGMGEENGNIPHGNPMGMGISQKLGNWGGREWELNRLEWEGMRMLKAIPAHLYYMASKLPNYRILTYFPHTKTLKRQNAKTRFSQKLSNSELWSLVSTDDL